MITIGMLIIVFLLLVILAELKSKSVPNYSSELDSIKSDLAELNSIKSELSDMKERLLKNSGDAEIGGTLLDDSDTSMKKTLERISDDLFQIKLELKLVRIDELLAEFGGIVACEEEKYNLRTRFQRLYYCMNRLKRYIFWEGNNPDGIEKELDSLKKLVPLDQSDEEALSNFIEDAVKERNKEIGASVAWIHDKKSAYEYERISLEDFEKEKKNLSRIEAVKRLNRIQWRCQVLSQMEKYYKTNNSLKGWEYDPRNIYSWGDKDERAVLDF